jgi:SIR2-like domain
VAFEKKNMDRDGITKIAQACFSSGPAIILGSGASMPHCLPSMGELQKYLVDNLHAPDGAEADAWLGVRTALAAGDHLEKAMEGKNLPASLTKMIVELTWKCVNHADHDLFLRAISNSEDFPFGRLLHGLSVSSNSVIDVITTNYDRVAEYACNVHGLLYSSGFTPGYIQRREGANPVAFQRGNNPPKTIRIWKVHGSLDWFVRGEDEPFSAPVFEIPATDAKPLIVTPGLYKFEQTQYEPFRSIMTGADAAFERATGFICIGFGFRDSHIEPKLFARCKTGNFPVAVIARTLTDEAKAFLKNRAGAKYIGLEKTDTGTRIFTSATPDGIEFAEPDLWSLNGFLSLAT